MEHLAMDRFANMIAVGSTRDIHRDIHRDTPVGSKGLVYTISRQMIGDSDLASFVWSQRVLPQHSATSSASVDVRGASGYNATHFVVVGGPMGYAAISTSAMPEGGGGLESSPIFGESSGNADLRLTACYTPSVYTTVVATDTGKIYVSNDMTHTWQAAVLPDVLSLDARWLAMSGRSAYDEASCARAHAQSGVWWMAVWMVVPLTHVSIHGWWCP